MKNIDNRNHGSKNVETVIDVRPAARFSGETPDPRVGVKSGHMPYSKNIPFTSLINPNTGEMINVKEVNMQGR